MTKFIVKMNNVTFDLGQDDFLAICIRIGDKFALSNKQVKKLYNNGEITLKDGTFIEVYKA